MFSCPIKPSSEPRLPRVRLTGKAEEVAGVGGWVERRGEGGGGEEMRGDRFGCDQALPGCDSARLSQQLRLVTAADVLLCSTTRESPRTHTRTHTRPHIRAYPIAHAFQHVHAHTDAPPLVCCSLFCSLTVTTVLQAVHARCQDNLPEVSHITP